MLINNCKNYFSNHFQYFFFEIYFYLIIYLLFERRQKPIVCDLRDLSYNQLKTTTYLENPTFVISSKTQNSPKETNLYVQHTY